MPVAKVDRFRRKQRSVFAAMRTFVSEYAF
jgi:hypothetical protein